MQQMNDLKDGILHFTAPQQPNASDVYSTVGVLTAKVSLQFSYASIASHSFAESVKKAVYGGREISSVTDDS